MADQPDYYAELGVPPGAPAEEIKRAYRKLALDVHPDRGGSERRMRRLNAAWAPLGDPEARRAYDISRQEGSSPVRPQPSATQRPTPRRGPRERESPLIRLGGWIAGKFAFILGRLLRLVFRGR